MGHPDLPGRLAPWLPGDGHQPGVFRALPLRPQPKLQLSSGRAFADDPFEVVLGKKWPRRLNYQLDQELVLAHGVATISLVKHDDKPFKVVGIQTHRHTSGPHPAHLARLASILHVDWQNGMPAQRRRGRKVGGTRRGNMDLQPQTITAVHAGPEQQIATFACNARSTSFAASRCWRSCPAWRCKELWSLMGTAEKRCSWSRCSWC